jgi:circadian clock protein KaiC
LTELLPTGIAGLDEILNGGLVAGNSYVLKGFPGSGKTTLGIQYVHAGAVEHGEPGLILTFEERPERLFRDALSLGYDLQRLQREGLVQVVSSSPSAVRSMLLDSNSPLSTALEQRGVRRVMVDSLTAFRKVYRDEWELRDAVMQLISSLMARSVTPLLIREVHGAAASAVDLSFEDYLSDAVISLAYSTARERHRSRTIEVVKTRSHPHIGGRHSMRIGPRGVEVFPSCQARTSAPAAAPERPRKVPTGVAGLDAMLEGGLLAGSSTMLAGSSGTGKTTLGLQFLARGLSRGERGLFITLQEPPAMLLHEAQSVGLRLQPLQEQGLLGILHASPVGLDVDELLFRLREECRRQPPARIVLDSLSDVISVVQDEGYLRDVIDSATGLFFEIGATTLMSYEVPELFGNFSLSHQRLSGLIDNVIFLRYVEMESELKRAISVLKVRGSNHDKRIHELVVTAEGVQVATVFEGREGLMSGAPKRVASAGADLGMDEILDQMTSYQEARARFQSMKKGQQGKGPEPGSPPRLRPRP